MTIAIVGAGLAGTTLAYRLAQAGYPVTVYESGDRPGGRNKSVRVADCVIDTAATLMGPTYDQVFELITELGLEDHLEKCHGYTGTYRDGKFHRMSIDHPNLAVAMTGLIGIRSKLSLVKLARKAMRHSKDFNFHNLGTSRGCDDETLQDYCRRNFPDEVYEYVLNPTHKFLYLHDGSYGAVVEFFWWMHTMGSSAASSFKYGTNTLVDRLAESIDIRCGHTVEQVRRDGDGACLDVMHEGTTATIQADVCVVTTPAAITGPMCATALTDRQQRFMNTRRYERVTTVSFVTRRRPTQDVVVINMPSSQNYDLGCIIFGHKIASTRAPADRGIINTYWQHEWASRSATLSDQQIMEKARGEIEHLVPEVSDLHGYHVQRWLHTAPIQEIGACAEIKQFCESLDPRSPVQVIGDYMVGPCMNVAVTTANRMAASIIQHHPGARDG